MTTEYHFTANLEYPKINDPFFQYTRDYGCQEFRKIKNLNELTLINNIFNNKITMNRNKEIKLIIYTRPLDFSCGGIVALHNLAKCINDMKNPKILAKLFIYNGLKYRNIFCENFASIEEAQDENAVVVYPEIINGNPLNCKKVIRWILLGLGKEMPIDHYKNWSKDDLVYYFNSESNFHEIYENDIKIHKMLSTLYINAEVICKNYKSRSGVCFSIRKAANIENMNNRKVIEVHPPDSFEITREHTQLQCIEFFNNYKWFMCYDSLTFYIVIAALCGCVPVVYKVAGLDKKEWIQTTAAADYCKYKGIYNLFGIAYGQEDMKFAEETIHLAKAQWDDILKFNKEKTVVPFINDLENFKNQKNTVGSVFYTKTDLEEFENKKNTVGSVFYTKTDLKKFKNKKMLCK